MKSSPETKPRRLGAGLALVLVALGGAALGEGKGAVAPQTKVYIRARNTRLMKSSALTAKPVKVLQPGDVVTYLGVDPTNPQWHRVSAGNNLEGVVFQSNLSLTPPKAENLGASTASAVELKSYASKGAAIKALGPGALDYAKQNNAGDVALRIAGAEQLAKDVSEKQLAEHATKVGLFPVVGPVADRGTP